MVTVTHPFHPLCGQGLVFVARLQCWRGDLVFYLDETGCRQRIPAVWTDIVPDDPFRVVAGGRCAFRSQDLIAVAQLVDRLRGGGAEPDDDHVWELTP